MYKQWSTELGVGVSYSTTELNKNIFFGKSNSKKILSHPQHHCLLEAVLSITLFVS